MLRRMINERRVWECTAVDDSSVDSATTDDSADFPSAPGGVFLSMADVARAAGVEAAAASIPNDGECGKWELKKIFDVKELGNGKPQMCTTDICNLHACSKWVSSHDEWWFPCVDCQEK